MKGDALHKRIVNFVKRYMYRLHLLNKVTVQIGNNLIILHDISQSHILMNIAESGYKSYEPELVRLIEKYPWSLEYFIDVGSNIGFYSFLAEKVMSPDLKIISVEPYPPNINYIKKLKENNNLKFSLIEKAIDDKENETCVFYVPAGKNNSRLAAAASLNNSFKGTNGLFNNTPYKTVSVSTTTLPAIVKNMNGRTLFKLDCEGKELSILSSSDEILNREDVDFIIEIMINDKDKNDVFNIMKKYGYSAYLISHCGFIRENRPLTMGNTGFNNRTLWRNHFFTKRSESEMEKASRDLFGYWI
jgi:FkbM family methyltransferase